MFLSKSIANIGEISEELRLGLKNSGDSLAKIIDNLELTLKNFKRI